MTTPHNQMVDRYDAARATHKALVMIEGIGVGEMLGMVAPPVGTKIPIPKLYWQVGIKTGSHGMIHVYEDREEGIRILRRNERGNMAVFFQSEDCDPRTLSTAICHALIGRGSVPAQSRKQVREVLHAAEMNADYHFREGVRHLLTDPSYISSWADAEGTERWDMIVGAFNVRMNTRATSFMHTWQNLGVPLAIVDIYEDRYIDRARELLATIGSD